MNRQDVMMLSNALQAMQQGFLSRKMREEQTSQRSLDNQMRREMLDLQKKQDADRIAQMEREFTYRQGRDNVGDTRYTEETGYRRGRDTVADQRDTRNFDYGRGRDTVADFRQAMRDAQSTLQASEAGRRADEGLDLQRMQLALTDKRLSNAGAVTEELDPDTGEVQRITRRRPLNSGNGTASTGEGTMTRDQLLQAVKTGKMSKAQAKAYAQQHGIN